MDLTFFNPRSQSEPDFIASFVARKDTLEFFLRQLRQLGPEEPARHQLIVAPRGYGKTSLLRRIAIAVRTDDSLSRRYLPLSFREEQHNVISLDVFWRNCIQSLLEAREEEHASEAELDEIDAAWARLAPRQDLPRAEQDGEPQWLEFRSRCETLGRRPILLIDNLDTLLAGLESNHQWTLRQTLQMHDGPVILAAASRYPESTHEPDAAFYEFFRIQTLDRLENQEVLFCLRALAQHRGTPGKAVIELLDSDPGRIAALNVLAGGNPRTLGVLYAVLESHMSTDVLSQLSAMLDTFTGWYQARTEELPMQARAVFDALALNWDPMTAANLRKTTGLEIGVVSSQLSRLEKLGYVESVALSRRGKGRSGYQLVERFFNIWYLMRNGPRRARQSIKFLTAFLQSCFNAGERRALGRRVLDAERTDPGYAVALASTMNDGELRQRLLDRAHELSMQSPASPDYQAMLLELRPSELQQATTSSGNNRKSGKEQSQSPSVPSMLTAADDMETGRNLLSQGKFLEAITVFNRVIARNELASDVATQRSVARALISKGIALRQLDRAAEALAVYDDVAARYGHATEPALQEQVARALVNKGTALRRLGRADESLALYDDVVFRHAQATEPALQERAAQALVSKGISLSQLGRTDEALAVFEDVAARYGHTSKSALQEQVALALTSKGVILSQLGRADEALTVYDDVAARYGQATESALQQAVALTLAAKGIVLSELGRTDEALAVYDDVATRYSQTTEPTVQEHVARALVSKGMALGHLGRTDEALAVYDDLAARYSQATEPTLQERAAWALVRKGIALRRLDRVDESLALYDDVVFRYGQATEPALQERAAWALVNKGLTLSELGRTDEALAVYDDVAARYGQASKSALQEQVALALISKGVTLSQLNRTDEALAMYDDVAARYGQTTESALQELVARAMAGKGIALRQVGRADEALAVYDDMAARYGRATEPTLQEQVALALRGAFEIKRAANDIDAAVSAARRAVAYSAQQPEIWNSLGNLLFDQKGDVEGADQAYQQGLLVANVEDDIAVLSSNRAYLLALHSSRYDEAQASVQRALSLANGNISDAGRHLLSALPTRPTSGSSDWERLFNSITSAVDCNDSGLWTRYLDDLQRLIWYVVVHNQGDALRSRMENADYPIRQAPLYHAVIAAIEGEDHLLKINPEVRGPAQHVYEGIARLLKLYGNGNSSSR